MIYQWYIMISQWYIMIFRDISWYIAWYITDILSLKCFCISSNKDDISVVYRDISVIYHQFKLIWSTWLLFLHNVSDVMNKDMAPENFCHRPKHKVSLNKVKILKQQCPPNWTKQCLPKNLMESQRTKMNLVLDFRCDYHLLFNPFDTNPPLEKFSGRKFFSKNIPESLDQGVSDQNFWQVDDFR